MGGAGWPGWLVCLVALGVVGLMGAAGWPGWLVCLVSLGDVLGPVLVLSVSVLLGCEMRGDEAIDRHYWFALT